MTSVIYMIVIAGNTLFKVIFTDQTTVLKGAAKLNTIANWTASVLGTALLLITILALPHIFSRKKVTT